MNCSARIWGLALLWSTTSWLAASTTQAGPITVQLKSADTTLVFEASTTAPRLVTLQHAGELPWTNRTPETLIDSAEVSGQPGPLHWQFNREASQTDGERVAFVYDSAAPKLRLVWEWRKRAAHGPIEHSIHIENLDSQEIWLPLQDSFRFDWQVDIKVALEQFFIEKGADRPSAVGTHQISLTSNYRWEGTSSTYAHPKENEAREIIPWFLVERTGGSESGWYVGIEFSGRTRLSLTREDQSLRGAAGLNPNPGPFRTRLKPDETFHTPTVFVGGFRGGPDGAGKMLRPWVKEVLTNPKAWEDPRYPLAVNNSWGGGMDVNEDVALRMIRDSAQLGLEMFHLDAGWFRGVGDWYPDARKFPHGLAAIADEAHQRGLKFGLWVDWTQAALDREPGALNVNDPKVRDWMVTDLPSDWKPEPFKGQTIDLGVPAAKEWAQHEVERIVSDYHLDVLKHDGYLVAQGCDRTDHPHAAPDPWNKCVSKAGSSYWVESSNSADVSYHAVRSYYDIYSKLRNDHPDLLLEVCNDGGRMVDFGSAAHGDYFSITDSYDPLSNRRAFYDASYVLPAAMLEDYVERWPTPGIENFRYMLRSGMMGWLTIMQDTTFWTVEQHGVAKEEFQLYKTQLRPLIRDADLYHISSRPDGIHWDGMQYFDAQSGRGVVYAFRGATETEPSHTFVLRGVRAESRYRLCYHDHSAPDRSLTGRELLSEGLMVKLLAPNSSEIIFVTDEAVADEAMQKESPAHGHVKEKSWSTRNSAEEASARVLAGRVAVVSGGAQGIGLAIGR